jgi:hypothetical protein
MMNRRQYLLVTAGLVCALPLRARELPTAAAESPLIYITAIRSDGRESSCQAEVWFVQDQEQTGHLYVVTAADAWRAEAVRRGLTNARIWIGDLGVWSRSGRHRALPQIDASAALVGDPAAHARLLEQFGRKYTGEWSTWGPRFAKGLADGSRVMLEYRMI